MQIFQPLQFGEIQGFRFGSWPFGPPRMFSHAYFIDGLLVDTGHRNMRQPVLAALRQLPIDQIFITHHHEDHCGNLKPLQQHFQVPTFASSLCVEIMKKPPAISFAQWLTWGKAEANFNIQAEDRKVRTARYRFEIIPVPGHAVDMVCLYEAEQGWLFSSDLFVKEYIRYFMRSESMNQQIESIRRVLEFDFELLLCGHNPQEKGGKQKLKAKLDFFTDFYGRVASLHHKGYTINGIFKEMQLARSWPIRLLSTGELSTLNMIRSVIRDEEGGR